MYSVVLSQRADKYLNKLDSNISKRIKKRLKYLENTPIPTDAKFLGRNEGDKIFRYRIGSFRALYKIKQKEEAVLITNIDKRPRVYSRRAF